MIQEGRSQFAKLGFLADLILRRKPIFNVGNLIGRFCYRNFLLWKIGLSGLISNS